MSSDIWNPWHGCRKYSEGCDHCYMYYLDNERGKSGGEIYKVKTNSDLLLNFVFKLYHKTCEQFYRSFGIYEKSPNSFLPGLSRSIVNQFCSGGQRYSAGLH